MKAQFKGIEVIHCKWNDIKDREHVHFRLTRGQKMERNYQKIKINDKKTVHGADGQ
jgi:hypothetical protein